MGASPSEHELIYSYVGNGAPVLIRRAFPGASEEELERALAVLPGYYREHMLDYTVLYPGVRETLEKLDNGNRRLAVLTNKPVRISAAILDGLGVGSHFFRVYGGNSFEQKKPHPDWCRNAAARNRRKKGTCCDGWRQRGGYPDGPKRRHFDVVASLTAFNPRSLQEDPPDFLIERMDQIFRRLQLS